MSIERLIYIYTLSDPITKEIRYVGKTIQKPTYRLYSHISQSKHNSKKDYCHCWIKSLLNKDLKPTMDIIEETFDIKRETYWIKYYRNDSKLTNFTDGGDLGNLGKSWKISEDKLESYKYKTNKPVLQYDLKGDFIKEWVSCNEFSRFHNLKSGTVSYNIRNKQSYKHFILIYKGDDFNLEHYKLVNLNKNRIIILDILKNIKYDFENATLAAKTLNLNNSSISKCAKNKKLLYKQYKIKYYDFVSQS